MEDASPARLYACVVGVFLFVLGIGGFFGVFDVDTPRNLLYGATGAVGLLAASYAPRPFALAAGLLYTLLAIRGFTLPDGEEVLDLFPSDQLEDWLRLAVGLLGLAAAAGTPRTRLKARANAARERA